MKSESDSKIISPSTCNQKLNVTFCKLEFKKKALIVLYSKKNNKPVLLLVISDAK